MNKPLGGLGRGLGSLIPQKIPVSAAESADQSAIVTSSNSHLPVGALAGVTEISPNSIEVNPHQPRAYFAPGDLEDLVASIKEHGILQPLVVTDRGDGEYELIAGERRLRASKQLGLKTVPVIIRNATDQQKLELALIENIQRQDLNAIEEARAYQSLIELFSLTQEQAALRVGKSRSNVANTLRLLELDPDVQQALMEGKISRSHARTLLSEPDEGRRRALFEKMLGGGMTVREAEARAGSLPSASAGRDPNVTALEAELREALGTKVNLSMKGGAGRITIHFYSKDELKNMIKKLTA